MTGGGLLVEPDDPDALADGILALRTGPGAGALRWAKPAPRASASTSASERMAEHVEKIYEEML